MTIDRTDLGQAHVRGLCKEAASVAVLDATARHAATAARVVEHRASSVDNLVDNSVDNDSVGNRTVDSDAVLGRLDAALRALAPAGVRVGARRIDAGDLATLHPEEEPAVARAVASRRHEFATGRALLRSLIGRDVAIPVAPNRSPVLPAGVVGSLAHDREFAVAAVTTERRVTAIGIDIEPTTALSEDMARSILRADERHLDAHLAFTLKEATYKAWSVLGGRMLEFHEVRLDVAGSAFRAEVVHAGLQFEGVCAETAGRWVAMVVVMDGQGMTRHKTA
jgi:4'-phosphopantetheinyl transferase EntD